MLVADPHKFVDDFDFKRLEMACILLRALHVLILFFYSGPPEVSAKCSVLLYYYCSLGYICIYHDVFG